MPRKPRKPPKALWVCFDEDGDRYDTEETKHDAEQAARSNPGSVVRKYVLATAPVKP